MDNDFSGMARVRVVLVGTQHPGNIGSSARAMKTMGLRRLFLVDPERFPHNEADMLAAGADDVLGAAIVVPTLADALGDCRLVLGCTARGRRVALDELDPRQGAVQVRGCAQGGGEVALVFGRERTGLTNEELHLCHAAVRIPADPAYTSLNLAAAVQVLAYECHVAWLGSAEGTAAMAPAAAPGDQVAEVASHAELEGFFSQLADTLEAIDFHKGRAPQSAMRKLRRLFLRGQLDSREVRLLRGILADAQRMAGLARAAGAQGQGGVPPTA